MSLPERLAAHARSLDASGQHPGGGGGGGGDSYHHDQGVASQTWTVNHNLGRHPVVSVLDSSGSQVEVGVLHTTVNQVVLSLAYATSGTADCS